MPAGIVVNTPSGQVATESLDGTCDILEAIEAANTDRQVHECPAGHGVDRIILTAGATYLTPKTLRLATSVTIGIADASSGNATISAAPGFSIDPADRWSSCLVYASVKGGAVKLADVTLSQDPSSSVSGACVTRGFFEIRRGHVTGFRQGGIVGYCLPELGCDHETDAEDSTTITVLGSLVDGNRSPRNGGGVFSEGSGATLVVEHSAIVNNVSQLSGGGLYFGGGWNTHRIEHSTVSGNSATAGGGVFVSFAPSTATYLYVFNSTIARNTATSSGGGIEFHGNVDTHAQDVTVMASIISNNTSTTTPEANINADWRGGMFGCDRASLIYVPPALPTPARQTATPCRYDVPDALLGPLMAMGGAANLPVHPLLRGSPAIDAATNDFAEGQQRDSWVALYDPPSPPLWTVFDRLVDGDGDGMAVQDLGAYEANDVWQTELLSVEAKGSGTHGVVMTPDGYDRGAGTTYAANNATGQFVTYIVPIAETGSYAVSVGVRQGSDAGQFQVAVADDASGPWTNVGTVHDTYAASGAFAELNLAANHGFASAGQKRFRFTVTGKNAASAGHRLFLDYVKVKNRFSCPVRAIAAGANHTCALTAGKGVRCWGLGREGQLGGGATENRSSPPSTDVLTGAVAIAAGTAYTCALTSAGGVRCWGFNGLGQLGDGTTVDRASPPATDALTDVKAIAAGGGHTCALTNAGGVRCWGNNHAGQLGDGTLVDRFAPPDRDVLTGVKQITAGGSHTCVLMTNGGVRCWGRNGFGQLGDGTMDDRASPPGGDAIVGVRSVSAGDAHTCVLTDAGGVRCWGHNIDGELGTGKYDPVVAPPLTDVLTGAKAVIAGFNFTCAVTISGGVRCWGYNSDGQLGDDTELNVDRLSPPGFDVLAGANALAVGWGHACALMVSGGVRCWGANADGQLGDGRAPDYSMVPPTTDLGGLGSRCP